MTTFFFGDGIVNPLVEYEEREAALFCFIACFVIFIFMLSISEQIAVFTCWIHLIHLSGGIMPTLAVSLDIKFRDLFKFSQVWSLPLPEVAELAGNRSLLDFNQRGVHLIVTLKKA